MAKGVVISLLIIAIGIAWLLNTLHFIGGVDWIWTISLGAAGLLTLAWGRINKFTFVMGLFLVVGSVLSVLRQTGAISVEVEVPVLVIIFGLLFLIAQLPIIPLPQAVVRMKEAEKQNAAKSL
ncbi:MAG TPA: hypothetical protein VHM90_20850 [Phycisphaerae bacterium]|jgi:hypothetical protein|nr:hypothetical protein [Phycisphaerae bacterium]